MPDAIRGVGTTDPITAPSSAQTGATNSAAATVATATQSSPGTDFADVTQTETLLQSIVAAATTVPGIDAAKVADLQQAIASGTYQVNAQSIAQKLVELDGQLDTAGQLR
jgi:negative regulator of flagellin synthesis FlgM